MKYKVAIALAIYNGEKWLVEQLNSLLSQDGVEVTIFVRIDPSIDNSQSIIELKIKEYDNIVLIPNSEVSGCAAINFFKLLSEIDLDKYDYLSFADQDDVWSFDKLVKSIETLNEKGADAYSSNLFAFNEEKTFLVDKSQPMKNFDYLFQGASAGCTYVLKKELAVFIQRKIIDNFEKLPVRPSHDWMIYAISRSYGYKWILDNRSFIFYRQHQNNVRGAVEGLSDYIVRLKAARTGWYKQHIVGLRCFLKGSEGELNIIKHVESYNIWDRIYLFANARTFRRKRKEVLLLSVIFILGFL